MDLGHPQAHAIPPLSPPVTIGPAHSILPVAKFIHYLCQNSQAFLGTIGISVLSGMWSRPYPSGAGAAGAAGATASRSSVLVVNASPTTFYRNHHWPSCMQAPQAPAFCSWCQQFKTSLDTTWWLGDILGKRVSKYGREKNLELPMRQDPSMPDDGLSLVLPGRIPWVCGSQAPGWRGWEQEMERSFSIALYWTVSLTYFPSLWTILPHFSYLLAGTPTPQHKATSCKWRHR